MALNPDRGYDNSSHGLRNETHGKKVIPVINPEWGCIAQCSLCNVIQPFGLQLGCNIMLPTGFVPQPVAIIISPRWGHN